MNHHPDPRHILYYIISVSQLAYISIYNEEQIITGYPIDGAMGSLGGWRVPELAGVCLHNKATVARGILVTILHSGTPEPRLNAIYIVGTSFT